MTYNSLYFWPFNYIIRYFFPENKIQKKNDLIYFDFETTGLNPYHDKIIEYAFIQEEENENYIKDYDENTYITSLVNPNTKFDKKITDITGIYPDELIDEKIIDDHLEDIMNFINYDKNTKSIYLVAHNCDSFDRLFLISSIKKYNETHTEKLDYKHIYYIDTLNLAKKLLPNIKSYSLRSLSHYYNIKSGNHRALSDTICLRELYHHFVREIADHLNKSHKDILNNPDIVYDFIN